MDNGIDRTPRIVGIRQSFHRPEVPAWRGELAAGLLAIAVLQILVIIGHLLWLGETWLYHLVR